MVDLMLALGLTLRLSRVVTGDDIGKWWLHGPTYLWANRTPDPKAKVRRLKWQSGLNCPFCVGFWIGCAVLASLWLVGGPGHAAEWWRWIAGAFALNWVVGHTATRMGDVD
jgi:hypothetical protein